MMKTEKEIIQWSDFQNVHLRKGTVVRAERFAEARKPSLKVWVDFGRELGVLKTSAQITVHYQPEDLPGRPVIGVTNFASKQIGPFMSEFLMVGFEDEQGAIILASTDPQVPNGALLK